MKKIILSMFLLGTLLSANAQTCWQRVSEVKDHYLRIVKVSNNVYLAAAGNTSGSGPASTNSLYISSDLKSWNSMNISFPSPVGLAFNIDNNGVLYISTQHAGVYSSSDTGKKWNYANVGNCYGCMALDFESDSINNLYVGIGGSGRGLNLSINNGATWTNKISSLDFTDIEFIDKGVNKVYASNTNNGIYSSSNNGNTWQQILSQPFSNNSIMIKQLNSVIYLFSNNGNIYKSTNGGNSWVLHSNIPISGTATPYCNDAVFMDNSVWWVGLYQNGIWRSENNGISWSRKDSCTTGDFHYLFKQGSTLLATTSEGIFKLDECLDTFAVQPSNLSGAKGANKIFSFTHSGTGNNYNWQSNSTALGWQNVPNAYQYAGATTNSLTVNNLTVSNHNQLFRVITSKASCADTSKIVKLTVSDVASDSIGLKNANDSISKLNVLYANKHDTLYIGSTITSDTLRIAIRTGISSLSPLINSLKVYPNPASNLLHIDLEKPGYFIAKLSSITGQSIITPTSGTIDVSSLANGVYILTIYDSNNKLISTNKVAIIK